ncbi:MAG TPA: DNA repair protein RecO [Gemmatimonadales bacterium]|nr:DNA repair protein RecO [Gemmatimonadales bacterium]
MALVTTPAVVLAAVRYGETSKVVRLATEELGVQSAIAKGALRPRSRFGAALQLFSEGQAQLHVKEGRELHVLAAFDVTRLELGLAAHLERYAAASALAEVMLRFAPAAPHPDGYAVLRAGLLTLETVPADWVESTAIRTLWRLVSVLGFAPSLDFCVRDGAPLPSDAPIWFSAREGGALCDACAAGQAFTRLEAGHRHDLAALLDDGTELPPLDRRHAAAHRRLLLRYIQHHLSEGAHLPALDFWVRRPWAER